jgi:hypothetical protein
MNIADRDAPLGTNASDLESDPASAPDDHFEIKGFRR